MKISIEAAGKKSVRPKGPGPTSGKQLQPSQQVNRLGKYLYKNLDGAFKIKNTGNTCDVYITVLYQIPPEVLKKYNISEDKYQEVHEMTVDINITTYQNKVRINVIEVDENEKTIGFDLYTPDSLEDLKESAKKVFQRVCRRIEKEFQDYEFLF